MTATTLTSPRATHAPRTTGTQGTGFLGHIWTGLKAIGRGRARQELLSLANSVKDTRPEFAAQLRATARDGWM